MRIRRFRFDFADWNIEREIAALAAPTLLVQGTDDEYGTLDQLDRIESALTGPMRRPVLEGAGHSPHLTHTDEVVAGVASFISSL